MSGPFLLTPTSNSPFQRRIHSTSIFTPFSLYVVFLNNPLSTDCFCVRSRAIASSAAALFFLCGTACAACVSCLAKVPDQTSSRQPNYYLVAVISTSTPSACRSRRAPLSSSRQLRTMASDPVAEAAPTSAGLQFTDLPQEIQKDIISHVSAGRGPLPHARAPAPSGRPKGIPLNHSRSAINQSSSACLSSPTTSGLWLPPSCIAISTLSSPTRTTPPSTRQ